MYRVYFDDILQDEIDIININDIASVCIIREDGFDNQEQILREKTDMEIQFAGKSFTYICSKINNDKCSEIKFKIIEEQSGLVFLGLIPSVLCELNLFQRIGKAKIKDNSFSAYIRDFMESDVRLFYTRTKNCLQLETPEQVFELKKTFNNDVDISTITAFDVLDIFKYLVSFFTDNKIGVVSTFLTNNRYAITTGFNLYNGGNSAKEIYPKLSISSLFTEIRKKLRIYMSVERDNVGVSYLRIEDENYFYSNTSPLFSIDEIQNNTIQTYDTNRNFNEIEIGSSQTEVTEGAVTYTQEDIYAWNEENFIGCGTCTGDKNNKLDLVSDYVIDSNLIYEGLNSTGDWSKDDAIILFNYKKSGGKNVGVRTLVTGEYHYNDTLRNVNVLENWIDYHGKCIGLQRTAKYGFLCNQGVSNTVVLDSTVLGSYFSDENVMRWSSFAFDNKSVLTDSNVAGDTATVFTCQENGDYNFNATLVNILQRGIDDGVTFIPNGGATTTNVDYKLYIRVYTDNTFTSLIDEYVDMADDVPSGYDDARSLQVTTGLIPLLVGNTVIAVFKTGFDSPNGNPSYLVHFWADSMTFKLVNDGFACVSDDYNEQNSKPFIIDFDYPLTYDEFLLARENKKGYINVMNNKYWIKEIKYKHNRLSNLRLIGNNSLCI